MAVYQRQIPGGPFANETDGKQRQIPGGPFLNDTASAASGSTGTVAYTNANDTSSASGTTTIVGTSATTNAADTSSASGSAGSDVTGSSATTNANDTSSAAGTTTVVGTASATNAADTASAAGWAGAVSGTVAAVNDSDYSNASGTTPVMQSDGGGGWEYIKPRFRTREEVDAERRKLGILPPSVEVSAAKSARKAIAERAPEEKALRDAVEALRAEVGKRKAAQLRQQYVAAVRLEMERELLRQRQEEEEVIAILAIQLLAA